MQNNNFKYCKKDKTAFLILGYGQMSGKISKVINFLKESEEKFKNLFKDQSIFEKSPVKITTEILNSSRYKYMFVAYVENIESCPEGAFEYGDNWKSMWDILSN